MEKERTIMIFPKFDNMKEIDQIRNKYDPLANLVRPHITIVFPFRSYLKNESIKEWMQKALKNTKPFRLELYGISKEISSFGNYLFLNVSDGKTEIEKLNKLLYTGVLQDFKANRQYNPHMTIGKFVSEELLNDAYHDTKTLNLIFQTMVYKISVEMIGVRDESIIEFEYVLE